MGRSKVFLSGATRASRVAEAAALLCLVSLAPPALGSAAQAASLPKTAHSPLKLSGSGIGSVHFGDPQPVATTVLQVLLGKLSTTYGRPGCGITAWATAPNVQVFFEKRRFVGYDIGSTAGRSVPLPNVITTSGLRIGYTLDQARHIYGTRFSTSAAQGGSWSVDTLQGRLFGYLFSPPVPAGPSDKIASIAAGYVGCPAMTP
jgi:hypothetical protein